MTQDARVQDFVASFEALRAEVEKVIVGHREIINHVLIGMFAGGHVLLEGVPGLGKTLLIKTLAEGLELSFSRIQFTPDLMPADIIGTNIIVEDADGRKHFQFQQGPIFAHILLADEINRATPKTQSALLEGMQEASVTVGGVSRPLPGPFFVLATQNPIEMEGTYPLPEAQLDRFLMHVVITYPNEETEGEIIKLNREENAQAPKAAESEPPAVPQQAVFDARAEIDKIFVSDLAEKYMVDVVFATRFPDRYGEPLDKWLQIGASPRGSLALDRCARVRAWLDGQEFVTPDHVRAVVHDCLRHRLILSYEAVSQGVNADQVIDKITELVSAA